MPPPVRMPLLVPLLALLLFAPAISAWGEEAQTVIVPLPPPQAPAQQPLITPPISPTAAAVPPAKPAPPPLHQAQQQQHRPFRVTARHLAAARTPHPAKLAKDTGAAEDRRIRRAASEELARRQSPLGMPGPHDPKTAPGWPGSGMNIPSRQMASAALPPGLPAYGYAPNGPPWYGPHGPPYVYPWPRGPAMPW